MFKKENSIKAEFDRVATYYQNNRLSRWYQAHAKMIAPYAVSCKSILDIGCATGYQLRCIDAISTEKKMIGLDLSPVMISQARMLTPQKNITFVCEDWENLSTSAAAQISQGAIDMIICANVYHYFSQPSQALKLMYEMLMPQGSLIILEREKAGSLLTATWHFLHRNFVKDHVNFYRTSDILEELEKVGFHHRPYIERVKKYFWKGKLFTSLALIKVKKE